MSGFSPIKETALLFIPTLEAGGAERVCLHYVNHLQVVHPVLVLQFKRGPLLQEIKPEVTVLELNTSAPEPVYRRWPRGLRPFYHSVMLLKHARRLSLIAKEHNCGVIISSITIANIIAVLVKTLFNRRLKVVVNVHDVTSQILQHSGLRHYERFLLYWLVRLLYPRADVIVAVARGIKEDLVECFRVPEAKIAVLPNPIDIADLRSRAAEPVSFPWGARKEGLLIVAVGRLVKLKGFDIMIQAFLQLPSKINARLIIIGDGEERLALETLIAQMGLAERVALLGFQENPWKYMAQADLFVLSSLTEGLPNVIGEALALGLPVLATDCSPGVREYLQDGQAGLLVPPGDPKALAQGLTRLLSDEPLRRKLAQRGRERVARFDLSTTVRAYETLLERLL